MFFNILYQNELTFIERKSLFFGVLNVGVFHFGIDDQVLGFGFTRLIGEGFDLSAGLEVVRINETVSVVLRELVLVESEVDQVELDSQLRMMQWLLVNVPQFHLNTLLDGLLFVVQHGVNVLA